jgi:hypothetical protein
MLFRLRGLPSDEYEQMVLGKWAWTRKGEDQDSFIVFREDLTCSFLDLNSERIDKGRKQCRWRISMRSL